MFTFSLVSAVLSVFLLCISGNCPAPKDMENALEAVQSTQYESGTDVTYTCDECYMGGGISTCQCDGTWSPVENCTSK